VRNFIDNDGHEIIEHEELINNLRDTALSGNKSERARAIQAQRYAKRRLECLVNWNFQIDGIERKSIITPTTQLNIYLI